jgi:hypothetical protein
MSDKFIKQKSSYRIHGTARSFLKCGEKIGSGLVKRQDSISTANANSFQL